MSSRGAQCLDMNGVMCVGSLSRFWCSSAIELACVMSDCMSFMSWLLGVCRWHLLAM